MAHLVENIISTKGIVPWHGLGTVTPKTLVTAEEIIREINFDFMVEKRQNFVPLKVDGKKVNTKLDDSYSIIRLNKDNTERVLCGNVGRNYEPIQNVDAFSFFDNVVGKGEAVYETAGILKNGRIIFLLASLPEHIKILGHEDDTVRPFVMLANWHDGTSALIAQLTDVRIVCNNTLNMSLSKISSRISIRHTKNATERFEEAARTMGLVNQYNAEMSKVFNTMALTKITNDQLLNYVKALIPDRDTESDVVKRHVKESRELVMELAEVGHGAKLDTAKGTVWGAYNAYVEYIDHGTKFRSDENRAQSILFGNGSVSKQHAFDLALDLTMNGN